MTEACQVVTYLISGNEYRDAEFEVEGLIFGTIQYIHVLSGVMCILQASYTRRDASW